MRAVREEGIAPLSSVRKMRDWWCCTNIYPFIAVFSPSPILSLSLSLSFFLSLSLSLFLSLFFYFHSLIIVRYAKTESAFSLVEWTTLSNVHISCHLKFLRPAGCERLSEPTGTDWTPVGRQPGGRRSCSCAPQPLLNYATLGVLWHRLLQEPAMKLIT